MPRKREVKKREICQDPKYHDTLMAKFINGIMRRGKKSTLQRRFFIMPSTSSKKKPFRPGENIQTGHG